MKNIIIISLILVLFSSISIDSFAQFRIRGDNGEARLSTNNMGPWDNTFITIANNDLSKCYIVSRGSETNTKFYVRGDGRCYGVGYHYITSDKRTKENIDTIANALSKILKLKGVKYNLKSEKSPKYDKDNHNKYGVDSYVVDSASLNAAKEKHIGLIAQDVEKVFPEAIDTLENGYKAIAYEALIGVLVEAIKEQQTQIASLQTIVNSQEQSIISLQDQIDGCCSISKNEEKSKLKSSNKEQNNNIRDINSNNAQLSQNTPNPFTENTMISYILPENTQSARLIIHNMNGIEIKSYDISGANSGSVTINGSELQAGMYLYTLLIDNNIIDTKRMLLTSE